jgi:hypothetical protein
MKSNLFANEIIPAKTFWDEAGKLTSLSSDQLNKLADWYNGLKVEPRRLDNHPISPHEVTHDLAKELKLSNDDFWELYEWLQSILRAQLFSRDDLKTIVEDMIKQGMIPDEQREKISNFFEKVTMKGLEFAKQRRRSAYERGQIASLSDLDYDVDLRLIPSQRFDPDNMKIEDYQPEGDELIPMALITITTFNGEQKNPVSFQVNFSKLEDLIINLEACQKDLRVIQAISQKYKK